ncbi:solute carrier family 52, riboflavin transporter, member 2 [Plakobranchus ocellatus]|uniref:Riboflavin transporter n=1 Tax=Plakobranchus ocellatus TaxID=259542 RepID=A0AAV3Y4T7_9GAST|nr:solute carrier family 52, riboflavin transporter, member 2 [Plakobranchus ocellatus]
MSQDLLRCGNVNVLVYLLVILFGVASWVDINGLWVELPILVQNLPEGWDLPSYMAIIIQVANIAPLLYTLASWLWPRQNFETPVIYIIISLGAVSCLLLAMLWDVTSEIAGAQRSTALLILQFFLALVDCTSSVAFLPFMFTFRPQYMTAYFIGEGFSGLIPSVVALGQGAGSMKCVVYPMVEKTVALNSSLSEQGHSSMPNSSLININTSESSLLASWNDSTKSQASVNSTASILASSAFETTQATPYNVYPKFEEPRFSVRTFFLILMALMIVSDISFTLLKYWGYCKKEYTSKTLDVVEDVSESLMTEKDVGSLSNMNDNYRMSSVANNNGKTVNEIIHSLEKCTGETKTFIACSYEPLQNKEANNISDLLKKSKSSGDFDGGSSLTSDSEENPKGTKVPKAKFILFLVLTAWLNAVSNGVLPSIQSYSCLPYGIKPYHLSVTLAAIANPVACFAASFITVTSVHSTIVMTGIGSALTGYIVYTAAASPNPPLVGITAGTTVLVLCWVLVVFFLTYTKVCIATVFRKGGRGPRALLWVGAFTQIGSLAGALVTFLLVNVYKVFTQGNPCRQA